MGKLHQETSKMIFAEWLIWTEAISAAGIDSAPEKIKQLLDISSDDLSPEQLQLLMKWHGLWNRNKDAHPSIQRDRLRASRTRHMAGQLDKPEKKDPTPHEVIARIQGALLKRGRKGHKWIKRADQGPLTAI